MHALKANPIGVTVLCLVLAGTATHSTAAGNPDNRYCGPGNAPLFGSSDGPAQLPQSCFYTAMSATPSPNPNVTSVPAGTTLTQLSTIISNAQCGDTIELVAGGVYAGNNLNLPPKNCDDQHWITIQSHALVSLPPEGTRISPCYAGVANNDPSLPGRPPYNCPPGGAAKLMPTIVLSNGSSVVASGDHYRLIGLEITHPVFPLGQLVFEMVNADGGSHIILDRVWIHGNATDETNHAVTVNDAHHVALIDSYVSDMHCVANLGTCTDAQAFAGGLDSTVGVAGTYKVVNNFLEAAAETIIFGGGGSHDVPGDIEIRRNHMYKPMIWNPFPAPGYIGTAFIVKNLYEMKNGQRALVEGNILENVWGGFSQVGAAMLLTPKNQGTPSGNNLCPLCEVKDITFRYNYITHAAQGLQIADIPNNNGAYATAGHNYCIHDMVFDALQYPTCFGCGNYLNEINGGSNPPPTDVLHDVTIDHVTQVTVQPSPAGGGAITMGGALASTGLQMYNINLMNNIMDSGQFGPWSTGGGATNCAFGQNSPLAKFNNCWNTYTFAGNAMVAGLAIAQTPTWPTGNFFPTDFPSLGFVNLNGGNGGDYHLSAGSSYKNAGTDGKDPGADINLVDCYTYNVISGAPGLPVCNGGPIPTSGTLTPPLLNLPAFLPLNAVISAAYNGTDPASYFAWTFTPIASIPAPGATPQALGNGSAYSLRPGASAAPAASLTTPSPQANLGSVLLGLGPYQVSVKVFDNSGNSSAPTQAYVTLVPSDLGSSRVFPNPWRSDRHKGFLVTFDNLTVNSSIKIFTVSGHHVKTLPTSSTSVTWDLTNDSGDKVASGLYVYLIMADGGQKKTGQIAVIK